MRKLDLSSLTEEKAKCFLADIVESSPNVIEFYRKICETNKRKESDDRLSEIGREIAIITNRSKKLLEKEYDKEYFQEEIKEIIELIDSQSVDLALISLGTLPISVLKKFAEDGKIAPVSCPNPESPISGFTALFIKISNEGK